MDVSNKEALEEIVKQYKVDEIYHLASLLSATSEHNPDLAWHVNVNSLKVTTFTNLNNYIQQNNQLFRPFDIE